MDVVQPGVRHGVAIERVLEHDLLLLHIGLRDEERFLGGGDRGGRPRHFNARHGADFHLFLITLVEFLRGFQGLPV